MDQSHDFLKLIETQHPIALILASQMVIGHHQKQRWEQQQLQWRQLGEAGPEKKKEGSGKAKANSAPVAATAAAVIPAAQAALPMQGDRSGFHEDHILTGCQMFGSWPSYRRRSCACTVSSTVWIKTDISRASPTTRDARRVVAAATIIRVFIGSQQSAPDLLYFRSPKRWAPAYLCCNRT
jgi:hypothetical protein